MGMGSSCVAELLAARKAWDQAKKEAFDDKVVKDKLLRKESPDIKAAQDKEQKALKKRIEDAKNAFSKGLGSKLDELAQLTANWDKALTAEGYDPELLIRLAPQITATCNKVTGILKEYDGATTALKNGKVTKTVSDMKMLVGKYSAKFANEWVPDKAFVDLYRKLKTAKVLATVGLAKARKVADLEQLLKAHVQSSKGGLEAKKQLDGFEASLASYDKVMASTTDKLKRIDAALKKLPSDPKEAAAAAKGIRDLAKGVEMSIPSAQGRVDEIKKLAGASPVKDDPAAVKRAGDLQKKAEAIVKQLEADAKDAKAAVAKLPKGL